MRRKLEERHRCLYLDSPPMVAGMRSYLSAAGVDVAREVGKGSLVLSSDQGHLVDGHFDVDLMLRALEDAVQQALTDGYLGLWATGDMTWEFGSRKEFAKLLEYEGKLEDLFRRQPVLSGICQYHAETLPPEAVGQGLLTHPSLFINETLSRVNPHYIPARKHYRRHASARFSGFGGGLTAARITRIRGSTSCRRSCEPSCRPLRTGAPSSGRRCR